MESLELISNYFIRLGMINNRPISNKKLQKLVYYSQAWSLALYGEPLFQEDIQAWVHGPVIPSLYQKYKNYQFHPIVNDQLLKETPRLDCAELLDEIWDIYGKYDSNYLELLTHRETPWRNARANLEPNENSDNTISLEDMKMYYSSLLNEEN